MAEHLNSHKIIVGVDYGTTFTGISYVSTDKNDINDIVVINNWPGPSRDTETVFKTPSRIAYASENRTRTNRWGFQVEPGMTAYSWTKLLLDRNTPRAQYDDITLEKSVGMGIMKLPGGKGAVDVCADFLRPVYNHLLHVLERQITKETLKVTPLEFWFTMPAIWSDQAQSATKKAAELAGFGSRKGDEINMITEPEAAGIATLKRSTIDEYSTLVNPGDGILVCDCGGGTVDITTYEIKETQPKLRFSELCMGTDSVMLSTRSPPKKKGPGSNFMKAFEQVKRDFGYSADDRTHELPLNMLIEKPDPDYFDNDERLVVLTDQDIRELFDPVVDRILELVGEQINEANKNSREWVVNRIILVGGFGDSEYLRQSFERAFARINKIQIIVPEQPQAAIVKGAALRGLEGIRPIVKRCRRHYGFSWGFDFRPGIDSEDHLYYDLFDGRQKARGRMKWLIGKGEEIFEDMWRSVPVSQPHIKGTKTRYPITLYSCSLEDAPERVDNPRVEEVGEINTDFSSFDLGRTFESRADSQYGRLYQLKYQVKVIFGAKDGILHFKTESKGKVMGTTGIKFAEEKGKDMKKQALDRRQA